MSYAGSPQAAAEAEKAAIAFQVAMARLGALGAYEALTLWQSVSLSNLTGSMNTWLREVLDLVFTRRSEARDLAVSYYRLVRALETGKTSILPGDAGTGRTTIGELRNEFAERLDSTKVHVPATPSEGSPLDPDMFEEDVFEDSGVADSEPVDVEISLVAGDDPDLELDAYDRWFEAQRKAEAARLEEELALLGGVNFEAKVKVIDDLSPAERDALIRDAHLEAGTAAAARAERSIMDGARYEVTMRGKFDNRAKGFVRQAGRANPCGWCAMLISRGRIFYQSKTSAQSSSKKQAIASAMPESEAKAMDTAYHDNCWCYSVPVFSYDTYYTSETFEINREMAVLWRTQITEKNLTGKDALREWRRIIRERQRAAGRGADSTQEVTDETQESDVR